MLRGSHRFTATGCVPKVRLSPLSQLRNAITGEIGLPRNNSPDTVPEQPKVPISRWRHSRPQRVWFQRRSRCFLDAQIVANKCADDPLPQEITRSRDHPLHTGEANLRVAPGWFGGGESRTCGVCVWNGAVSLIWSKQRAEGSRPWGDLQSPWRTLAFLKSDSTRIILCLRRRSGGSRFRGS
jgi:hypothetical protein